MAERSRPPEPGSEPTKERSLDMLKAKSEANCDRAQAFIERQNQKQVAPVSRESAEQSPPPEPGSEPTEQRSVGTERAGGQVDTFGLQGLVRGLSWVGANRKLCSHIVLFFWTYCVLLSILPESLVGHFSIINACGPICSVLGLHNLLYSATHILSLALWSPPRPSFPTFDDSGRQPLVPKKEDLPYWISLPKEMVIRTDVVFGLLRTIDRNVFDPHRSAILDTFESIERIQYGLWTHTRIYQDSVNIYLRALEACCDRHCTDRRSDLWQVLDWLGGDGNQIQPILRNVDTILFNGSFWETAWRDTARKYHSLQAGIESLQDELERQIATRHIHCGKFPYWLKSTASKGACADRTNLHHLQQLLNITKAIVLILRRRTLDQFTNFPPDESKISYFYPELKDFHRGSSDGTSTRRKQHRRSYTSPDIAAFASTARKYADCLMFVPLTKNDKTNIFNILSEWNAAMPSSAFLRDDD